MVSLISLYALNQAFLFHCCKADLTFLTEEDLFPSGADRSQELGILHDSHDSMVLGNILFIFLNPFVVFSHFPDLSWLDAELSRLYYIALY